MKNKEKMHLKEKIPIDMINKDCFRSFTFSEETAASDIRTVLAFFEKKCLELDVVFVYGKVKRLLYFTKTVRSNADLLECQNVLDKPKARFDGRNSFSKTDPDTFMHTKEPLNKKLPLKIKRASVY